MTGTDDAAATVGSGFAAGAAGPGPGRAPAGSGLADEFPPTTPIRLAA